MRRPEAKLLQRCRAYLDTLVPDVWHHKLHGSVMGQTGIPDVLICWRGQWSLVEFKATGEQPTRKQQLVANRIRRAGGVVTTIDNYEGFLAFCASTFN